MWQRQRLHEILIVSLVILSIWHRPAYAGLLTCQPQTLYRGEALTIELPNPHEDYEFAVWGEDLELMMISFKPGPKDKIAPVIAPNVFRAMKRIDLHSTTARGSPSDFWHGSDLPRGLGASRLIFINTGLYEVLLGPAIGAEDADFDGCWVNYINGPKPKSMLLSSRKPHATERNAERGVADVGSTTMSRDRVRALRKAAEDQGTLMIQEGDHFHLQF